MEQNRVLGWWERFMAGNDLFTLVSISQWITSNHHIDVSAMENAVRCTIQRHPFLRANIDTSQDPWRFMPTDDFSACFQMIRKDDIWKTVVRNTALEKIPLGNKKPSMLKVVLIVPEDDKVDSSGRRSFHLAVRLHHCMSDGRSGMIVTKDIMKYYSEFVNGHMDTTEEVVSLPPTDDVLRLAFPRGLSEKDKFVKRELDEANLNLKRTWKPTLPITDRSRSYTDAFLYRDGSVENLEKLTKRCHEENVTVGSVILASACFALANQSSKEGMYEPKISVAVDFRTRFPQPRPYIDVGFLVGFMLLDGVYVNYESKFWETVKIIKSKLDRYLADNHQFMDHLVNADFDPNDPLFVENQKLNNGHSMDLCVSNIGSWPFPKAFGECSLQKIYTVGGGWMPFDGSNLFLTHSTDHMCYCYTYMEAVGNETESLDTAREFFDNMVFLIENSYSFDNHFKYAEYEHNLKSELR